MKTRDMAIIGAVVAAAVAGYVLWRRHAATADAAADDNIDQADATEGDVASSDADQHGLRGYALDGARAVLSKYPMLVITSGRRDVHGQAHAMATNVVQDASFIKNTYKASDVRDALQGYVDEHPDQTVDQYTSGFVSILNTFPDDERAKISRHLSGDAFDLQPREDLPQASEIKDFINNLDGLNRFLEKESGLVRWHAQFDPPEAVS